MNALPLNEIGDENGWEWIPTRSGFPIPVNLARAMSKPQPLFNVENDVVFELYTLKNKVQPHILSPYNIHSITTSNFDGSLPTRIYIHGWQEYMGIMKKTLNDGKKNYFIKNSKTLEIAFHH